MGYSSCDHALPANECGRYQARILLSERDPVVRRLLVILIEQLGHEAVVIEDSSDERVRGDLLLIDAAPPRAIERARNMCRLDWATPIVCIDGLPEPTSVAGLGPVGYLPKPFTIAMVERTINATLALVWSCPVPATYCT